MGNKNTESNTDCSYKYIGNTVYSSSVRKIWQCLLLYKLIALGSRSAGLSSACFTVVPFKDKRVASCMKVRPRMC
ncbi:hypothetical protein KY285_017536 [Solanum tuberosum]|nr:hypothetical protein KY284_017544 [Solanum tuberosum]KAH0703258.1 hypothetical protein KY285_017536 [Solanum tuberosum]